MYVIKIDIEKNEVVLGEEDGLFSTILNCKEATFMPFEKLDKSMNITAKIRYSAKKSEATISPNEDGTIKVEFKNPQRAITPGQAVVFYDNDVVVGGGVII
ncbi:tRNA-specific 2-thiouridylase MnmA [compost metagenome]